MHRRTLVTGGLGFIGSALIRRAVHSTAEMINVDLDTYAGDHRRLSEARPSAITNVRIDVADPSLDRLVEDTRPELIVHFAAESHVTRSERQAEAFFHTNVNGTRCVMEAAADHAVERVIHVSTDEVYGPCLGEPFKEDEKLAGEGLATSAYARSKAIADDIALSYSDRVPVVVVRPTNCFGPWQHPEKAIARWIARALGSRPLPVWVDGGQIRDWMFVDDAVRAIETVIARGVPGEVYNIAPAGPETTNLEVARMIAAAAGRDPSTVYLAHYDRPDHDRRYAVDVSKIRKLGWEASTNLREGIGITVDWYRRHGEWWRSLLPDAEALYADSGQRSPLP